MTEDLSNIFEEARKYLWTAVQNYTDRPTDLKEDAVQEGLIQVWRDLESGVDGGETTKLKIFRRASMRARSILFTYGEQTLGKPKLSKDGVHCNDTIEKVRIFLAEYMPVHNNQWPMGKEVAQALGISLSAAHAALKNIKKGKFNHGVKKQLADGTFEKDRAFYRPVSLEGLTHDDDNSRDWHESSLFRDYQESWEDNYIDQEAMLEALKKLKPSYRDLIFRHFYLGETHTNLGKEYGFKNPSGQASATIRKGLDQLKLILYPYEGSCSKGHKYTEQNVKFCTRSDGAVIRQCLECFALTRTRETVAKPRKPKASPVCDEHGPKTLRDSSGSLRCHECRKAAQRRYAEKKKE